MKKYDISLYRGDDTILRVRLPEWADLTGCRLDLQARDEEDNVVLNLSTEDKSISIIEKNTALLHFSHATTAALAFESARYDLQIISRAGLYKTLMLGKLKLQADITRI